MPVRTRPSMVRRKSRVTTQIWMFSPRKLLDRVLVPVGVGRAGIVLAFIAVRAGGARMFAPFRCRHKAEARRAQAAAGRVASFRELSGAASDSAPVISRMLRR